MTKTMTPITDIGGSVFLATASDYPRIRRNRQSGATFGVAPAA